MDGRRVLKVADGVFSPGQIEAWEQYLEAVKAAGDRLYDRLMALYPQR